MKNLFKQALDTNDRLKATKLEIESEIADNQLQMNQLLVELLTEIANQWAIKKTDFLAKVEKCLQDNQVHFIQAAAMDIPNKEELIWNVEKKLPLQNLAGLPLLDCVLHSTLQIAGAQLIQKVPTRHEGWRIFLENATEFDLIMPLTVWKSWSTNVAEDVKTQIDIWLTGLVDAEYDLFEVALTGKAPPLTQAQKLNMLRTLDLEDPSIRAIIKQKIEEFNRTKAA